MKFKHWLNEQSINGSVQFKNYILQYEVDLGHRGTIMAFNPPNEKMIGYIAFHIVYDNDETYTLPGSIKVEPEYRRQGIATAMYSLAEKLTGYKIVPNKSKSDLATAVWNQPNRPFGN